MYVSHSGFQNQFAADRESPSDAEVFTFHLLPDKQFRLQTSAGKWVKVSPSGLLTATDTTPGLSYEI